MKDSGQMIKLTGKAHILIQMVPSMWENGRMISSMGRESKNGMMGRNMKGSIKMGRRPAEEFSSF